MLTGDCVFFVMLRILGLLVSCKLRFFYYNNGITVTCSHFEYPKQVRNPIINLENLQIVNGSQTIHALFEAFNEALLALIGATIEFEDGAKEIDAVG